MFDRFTADARQVVVDAQVEARALGHDAIGVEHLLLAAARPGSAVAAVLHDLGLRHAALRARVVDETDGDPRAALRDLGIDVDEVRHRIEQAFGAGALDDLPAGRDRRRWWRRRPRQRAGHLGFTRPARLALELSLRESRRLRSGEITAAHVVLGALAAGGRAGRVLDRLGVPPERVRAALLASLSRAA